jgi:tetratricopeptide (TPR) repeat protein
VPDSQNRATGVDDDQIVPMSIDGFARMLPITIEQALCIARQHWDCGRLSDAEGLYRRILREQPEHGDVLHLLGSLLVRAGRPTQALPFLARAADRRPDRLEVRSDFAAALVAADQFESAIAAYRRCIELAPDEPKSHAELGILLNRSGLFSEGIRALSRAVELLPQSAEYHFHLGVALANGGHGDRAITAYQRAIELDPSMPEPHANLGVVYRAAGKSDLALAAYGRALTLNPDCAEVHCNLGVALAEHDRMAEAIECYRRALSLNPQFVNAHFNLANAVRKQDQHEQAIDVYRHAIALQPDFVQAYSNMAMSFGDLGRHDLALAAYDRAVDLRPEWAEARWNRALTHLLQGDFERGWAEFDCRNQIEPPSSRTFPGERWNGENLKGKTVLLNYEMGLGDSIHFVRYVPLVACGGAARVILECQEPLQELFQSVAGADEVISIQRDQPLFDYDVHCSLMRLPQLYKSDPATMPRSVPYLKPSEARSAAWRERLGPRGSSLRVGLVWAGSPEHQNDRQRSIPLQSLASLADVSDVVFFSLQRGPAAAQANNPPAGMRLIDRAGDFENMADTAAAIQQLDLVISVDTSVAHLAGALGKAVWVLLAYVPDWRWLLDRRDTPWYPQMRLFRQPQLGDWSTPIRRIKSELAALRHRNIGAA